MQPAIRWQWARLTDLSVAAAYSVIAARETVFIVEQHCVYLELDGLDLDAMHLIGWSGTAVAAYARVLPPGVRFAEVCLGRVLTTKDFRRQGLGQELLRRTLAGTMELHGTQPIRISAQAHLQRFYAAFGFVAVSDEYAEDGIPHIEMLRATSSQRR
jgi:ElaA protein